RSSNLMEPTPTSSLAIASNPTPWVYRTSGVTTPDGLFPQDNRDRPKTLIFGPRRYSAPSPNGCLPPHRGAAVMAAFPTPKAPFPIPQERGAAPAAGLPGKAAGGPLRGAGPDPGPLVFASF